MRALIQKKAGFFILFASLFTACAHKPLSVYKETLSPRTLASWHAKTPDPLQRCPFFGERFWIFWDIHDWSDDLKLICRLRFQNDRVEDYGFNLLMSRGHASIVIEGDNYLDKGNIISYSIEVEKESFPLWSLKHPLFTEDFLPTSETSESIEVLN